MNPKATPSLPFAPDLESASKWLDELPVNNIGECCRLFYPALQALKNYPLEASLRFGMLEKVRPAVFGVCRGLLPHVLDKPFPLEAKTLKIAGLASRLHFELAAGYRQIAESSSFREAFQTAERALIIGRGLEHLGYGLLHAAQVYQEPSSSALPSAYALFRMAEGDGLADAMVETGGPGAASLGELFLRVLWFRRAVPNRLEQADIQRFFELLATYAGASSLGSGSAANGMRAVFCFDLADVDVLLPAAPSLPPKPGFRFLFPEGLLAPLRKLARASGRSECDAWAKVLPRLGNRLPCQEKISGRRALLLAGLEAIAADLARIQARRAVGGSREPWPKVDQLQLAPSGEPIGSSAIFGSKSSGHLAPSLIKTAEPSGEQRYARFSEGRAVEVRVSECPGFYLVDADVRLFRVGELIGLNTDDEVIQIGVVRAGQMHEARFWHSFELLGSKPRVVRARGGEADAPTQMALLFEAADETQAAELILAPMRWRGGEELTLYWPDGTCRYRVAKLLEMGVNFSQWRVVKAAG